jgi:hypothetical protein
MQRINKVTHIKVLRISSSCAEKTVGNSYTVGSL